MLALISSGCSVPGEYMFAIASDDNSEFWLSLDESTRNLKLMAFLGKWRLNKEESNFEVITSEFLSLYSDESSLLAVDNQIIPQTAASRKLAPDPISKPDVDMVKEDARDTIYKIPLLLDSIVEDAFPKCPYYPIYLFENDTIERYDGINHVRYSSVYPNDYTRLATEDIKAQICFYEKDETIEQGGGFGPMLKFERTDDEAQGGMSKPNWTQIINVKPVDFHSKQSDFVVHTCKRAGNIIMLQKDVMPIIKVFRNQMMSSQNTSELLVKRVLNVEKKTKFGVGSRYLLEIEMEDKKGKNFLISKYFYTTKNQRNPELPGLCSPVHFSWNPEGKWVIHFINEMQKIYQETGDKNFNVIITDYNSTDVDVEQELKNAYLPSYQFKSLNGRFAKALGIQSGVDLVEDKNSILFMCDLHIHFPSSIIDSVRKHCVQGKKAYAPVVMRLGCGATIRAPSGFWETEGYGLIGIYKSDMDHIGGMNVKEYTDKWGGEDWELLDRIVLNKLEVERLHLRNFAHFYHSKRGMWNKE
ncbi:hypothetical protein QTP70_033321 [Hemibagrus guttatus]|uniref:Hexosyltransferase n=1 Tax=Hemibagrus guttatus TaxID=175788 RepID=A0AAE0QCQ9_9TELE|nr:hypothetical protein QTP70_033321 [Hemibagrus guttatus]